MIINKDRDKTEGEIQKYPQCIQHFFFYLLVANMRNDQKKKTEKKNKVIN